jgi:hypothetical protein
MDFADNWNGSGNYKEKVSERTLQMNETQTFEQRKDIRFIPDYRSIC